MRMTTQIPWMDMAALLRDDLPAFASGLIEVVQSGRIVAGPAVTQFEEAFARFCGTAEAVGVSCGTSAIRLSLIACGVKPGDEVIVPALTFVATASAAAHLGARPVIVDIDPETWVIDPARVRAAMTPRTRAIVPVHLYGLPADMDSLNALAAEHGAAVVEDASQAHGATYHGRSVGSLAPIAAFSLYPTKNLGALGHGGVVTTSDAALAQAVRLWRDNCREPNVDHTDFGYNSCLDTVQAAFLLVRLRKLQEQVAERQAIAGRYRQLLAHTPLRWQAVPAGRTHAYHLCVPMAPDRDNLRAYLAERGVGTMIHYRRPLHLLPPGRALGYREGELPVAEAVTASVLSLPCYPGIPADHVWITAQCIAEYYGVALNTSTEAVAGHGRA